MAVEVRQDGDRRGRWKDTGIPRSPAHRQGEAREKSVEYEVTCEVKDKEKTYKVEKSIYDKLDIGETYKVKADSEEIVSIIE